MLLHPPVHDVTMATRETTVREMVNDMILLVSQFPERYSSPPAENREINEGKRLEQHRLQSLIRSGSRKALPPFLPCCSWPTAA